MIYMKILRHLIEANEIYKSQPPSINRPMHSIRLPTITTVTMVLSNALTVGSYVAIANTCERQSLNKISEPVLSISPATPIKYCYLVLLKKDKS